MLIPWRGGSVRQAVTPTACLHSKVGMGTSAAFRSVNALLLPFSVFQDFHVCLSVCLRDRLLLMLL